MTFQDKKSQEYMNGLIDVIDNKNRMDLKMKEKESVRMERIRTLKINENSQAVFGFIDNEPDRVFSTWSVSTGRYLSGGSKGHPRIPQRLNINSACLLTMKPDGVAEEDRVILGAFMVPDDFVGSYCCSGIVPAHDKYRIRLNTEKEQLLFWDYIPTKDKKERWGNTEMKYLSNITMQNILIDMTRRILDTDRQQEAIAFYQYYCDINQLNYEEI